MTRMDSSMSTAGSSAAPDVYTVLALIAVLALAVSAGFAWYYNLQLVQALGQQAGGNPFTIVGAMFGFGV